MNSQVIAGIAIGAPSLLIAFVSFIYATKARTETAIAGRSKVDADAYSRAKDVYESAIRTLQAEALELRAEIARQKIEVAELTARVGVLEQQLRDKSADREPGK